MTALKQRYLKAMGIDVWVRRGGAVALAEQSPPTTIAQPCPTGMSIQLRFVAYEGLGVVFTEPGETQAGACKRLCDDIALAMVGKPVSGTVRGLEWTPGDESMPAEAVGRELEAMPERIVAFGEVAREHLSGGVQGQLAHQFGKIVLGAPDITELLDQPIKKRDLWLGLLELQGA